MDEARKAKIKEAEGEYEFVNKAEGLRIMKKNIRNQAEDTSM